MELLLNDEVGQQKLLEELSQGGGSGGGGSGGGIAMFDLVEDQETGTQTLDETFNMVMDALDSGETVMAKITQEAGAFLIIGLVSAQADPSSNLYSVDLSGGTTLSANAPNELLVSSGAS